jgi:hypothetical protein
MVVVADSENHRISLYNPMEMCLVAHVATRAEGVSDPFDVQMWGDGLLVANQGSYSLLSISREQGGSSSVRTVCSEGLKSPTAVSSLPGLGVVVRERDVRRFRLLVPAGAVHVALDTGSPAPARAGPIVKHASVS